jgi:hypothetical protein
VGVPARVLSWQILRAYATPPLTRATVDLPTANPCGYWQGSDVNYLVLWGASSKLWNNASTYHTAMAQNAWSSPLYYIGRGLISINLTSLPAVIYPVEATLKCPYTQIQSNLKDSWAVMVDANGVPANNSGYGLIRDRTTDLGDVVISKGGVRVVSIDVPFKDAGLAWIQANAHAVGQLGLRISWEIGMSAPGPSYEQQLFNPWVNGAAHPVAYLHLVYDY